MKRILALPTAAVVVALLAGCTTVFGSAGTNPIDLTDASEISTLCGDDAAEVQATVASAADAKPNSGLRNSLTDWGITDPTDDKAVAAILVTLDERAEVKDCTAGLQVTTASDEEMTEDERAALAKALTVSTIPASAECKADENGNFVYQIDSIQMTGVRIKPDAISSPFKATDPQEIREELKQAICMDPNLGVAWLTFVATEVRDELKAATDIDLLELNPRLKEYTDVSQITPKATTFVTLLNVEKPTDEDLDTAIEQNKAWRQDAALVNTLLEKPELLGIEARQSIVNYNLVDYGLDVDSLPVIGLNDKEENLPALIFSFTEKGQCGELTTFGANVGDKRPELFEAKVCTPPTTTTPDCKTTGTCPTTDTPGCTKPNGCNPCTNCGGGEKTNHVPAESDDGGTEPPAPAPSGPAAPPEHVDTDPVDEVDTGTDLPSQDTGGENSGAVTD